MPVRVLLLFLAVYCSTAPSPDPLRDCPLYSQLEPWAFGRGDITHCPSEMETLVPFLTGISSPVKKTEMDKSPFNSPSPQDSPRLSSFTQHHRPVIAVHSGESHPGMEV